jgi:hypothetical protein
MPWADFEQRRMVVFLAVFVCSRAAIKETAAWLGVDRLGDATADIRKRALKVGSGIGTALSRAMV